MWSDVINGTTGKLTVKFLLYGRPRIYKSVLQVRKIHTGKHMNST